VFKEMSTDGGFEELLADVRLDDLQLSLLRSLAGGSSYPQAARTANVSEATMRRALRRARDTLGASTTIQAVYLTTKGGLI
jgi:DNA-binding NarL/FixJ family response regulator